MKFVTLILAILVIAAAADRFHRYEGEEVPLSEMPSGAVEKSFKNRIDHFNHVSKATYSQRYWESEDYWDHASGPMILHIFGESPARVLGTNSMSFELAKKLHGKVFMLEHRFYGISQPCEDWSLKCLRLLTHHQALADIANFIQSTNDEMRAPKQKWIIIGGSYAGALVGWFREKYPHLATVSYSSSGVINAITDYYQYMDQVKTDIEKDPRCYAVIDELNKFAVSTIEKGTKDAKDALKKAMSASMLDDLDFLSYFTDIYVGAIQYSSRKKICVEIVQIEGEKDMLKKAQKYEVIGTNYKVYPADYTLEEEKKININVQESSRQWMYQVCTAFGWFQTGRNSPLRPNYLGTEYWKKKCTEVFGAQLFPDQDYTNFITGDLRPVAKLTKTIFVNGGDDPWQWAGIRNEALTNDNLLVGIIKCDDCGHCVDLHAAAVDDPVELTKIREQITAAITKWIA